MSSEKMREDFEAWVLSCWPNQSVERFNALHGVTEGEYTGFTVQHCWEAWKASRASVVVELPYPGTDYDYSDNQVNGACKHHGKAVRVIKSLGLKVSE